VAEDLTPDDVQSFTQGRLAADDPETLRALDAALATVRAYCHWHVSPVRSQTVTLRGDGWPELALPTLQVVEIVSVTEDGEPVDLDDITLYRNVLIRKYGCWRGIVVVELSHGFTADEAAGWRDVVLRIVDRDSINVGDGGSGELVYKQVDDVQMRWAGGSFEEIYGGRLAPYRRTWWAA
jgi:hypothetical protein